MPKYAAVIDTDTSSVYVAYPEFVVKYDIAMYAAALVNPKYWEPAEESYPEGTSGKLPMLECDGTEFEVTVVKLPAKGV